MDSYLPLAKYLKLLLALCLLTTTASVSASCGKELLHGWGGLWEPFVLGEPASPAGLDMELLDAVIKAAGCEWKNTEDEVPWARHLDLLAKGDIDLAASASWTAERAKYAYFTQSYRSEYVAIFVLKKDLDKYSQLSLEELFKTVRVVGVERGNSYGTTMDALLNRYAEKVSSIIHNKQNISKLTDKRIDAYLGYLPYDPILIKEQGQKGNIVPLPKSILKTGEVHFILSRAANGKSVYEALEKALEEVMRNGTYDKIINKYSLKYGVSYW